MLSLFLGYTFGARFFNLFSYAPPRVFWPLALLVLFFSFAFLSVDRRRAVIGFLLFATSVVAHIFTPFVTVDW